MASKAFEHVEQIVEREYRRKGYSPARAEYIGRAVAGKEARQRNAKRRLRGKSPRKNPEDPLLQRAEEEATQFHGNPGSEVVALDPGERTLPRLGVLIGRLVELTYRPLRSSSRGDADWSHRAGDLLVGRKARVVDALLAADPVTGKPFIVSEPESMRFKSDRGLEG